MNNISISPSGISLAGSVALVVGRFVRNGTEKMNSLDPIVSNMYKKDFFNNQKFNKIELIFRYGIKTDLVPQYDRVSAKYKDLFIYVELDTVILDWADKNNPELLKEIYLIATCEAVLHVLRKYKLPTEQIENIRTKLGDIPLLIEDCESWTQKTPLTPEAILGFIPEPWLNESSE